MSAHEHRRDTMGEHSRKTTVNESKFSLLLSGTEVWRSMWSWGESQGHFCPFWVSAPLPL